jgi:hypothetical protein
MTPNWNPEPGTLNLTLNWAIGHQNGFEDILQRSFNRASTLKMPWPGWENWGGVQFRVKFMVKFRVPGSGFPLDDPKPEP